MLKQQQGESLLELLCALWLLALLLVGSQQGIMVLIKLQQRSGYRYQLDQQLNFIVERMAKSLHRAGYCPAATCPSQSITISQLMGEAERSCVIFHRQAYRLHQGNIEIQRNVTSCQSLGWERLLPTKTVVIDRFLLQRLSARVYQLQLQAHWYQRPQFHQQVIRLWWADNQ